ncbi:MAG: sarcosine oxidase subunit delta [Xanthomonadales bacterium]|nr:sarcosine oxidase subunit delta [Xanthomonadales bacterium]NIN58403.1 sarcosine oxidase subunit delta [Xanthomonadales bacterium]NIN73740.1 sarcosine oxidase subunit delta [Xanthomonadales bacterium]NIO14538.1 sarcosine oxidase subunit delta [Xanthomonadales bacterium]NIP10796.1 sarcosine oxidase subunit delta [Xanthomonadales bacterium]
MKQIRCPLNGLRNIDEFVYGGEYHPVTETADTDSRQWARQVFFHRNPAGLVIEWWCHAPSSYWFLAERDTRSNEMLRTFTLEAFLAMKDAAQ